MGQVWSKADFDGNQQSGFEGGRGSVLAVTAQNAGPDGIWETSDDLNVPLNFSPAPVSEDNSPDGQQDNLTDRVRGFNSMHPGGAQFSFGDGSVRFVTDTTNPTAYRELSTIAGSEIPSEF